MSFWVYMLRCSDSSYYVGHTDDIDARIAQHMTGQGGTYTALRQPVVPVFAEWFGSRDEAFARERQIKNWSRAKKEALIVQDWNRLSVLALPPSERDGRASLDFARDERARETDT